MDINNTRGIGFALIPNEGLTIKQDNANKNDIPFDNFVVRFFETGGLIPVIRWHALLPAKILESLQFALLFSGLIPSSLVWIQKDGHAGGELRVGLFKYIMEQISHSLMDYAPDLYLTVMTEINYITEQGMNAKNYLPGASYRVYGHRN